MALTKVDAQLVGGAITTDSSGNVGIGTSSPSGASGKVLEINGGAGQARLVLKNDTTGSASSDGSQIALVSSQLVIQNREASDITFETNGNERMRIDSSGNLLVGTNSNPADANTFIGIVYTPGVNYGITIKAANTSGGTAVNFRNPAGGQVGSIGTGNTSTTYATSSDYRLKENIAPMTGALDKVAQLKPVTYTWKADGSASEGFIAHELAEVCPDAVTGEKDAIDENGNIKPQGIDTSFLVATLTAAIQELKAELDATKAEVAALKAGA